MCIRDRSPGAALVAGGPHHDLAIRVGGVLLKVEQRQVAVGEPEEVDFHDVAAAVVVDQRVFVAPLPAAVSRDQARDARGAMVIGLTGVEFRPRQQQLAPRQRDDGRLAVAGVVGPDGSNDLSEPSALRGTLLGCANGRQRQSEEAQPYEPRDMIATHLNGFYTVFGEIASPYRSHPSASLVRPRGDTRGTCAVQACISHGERSHWSSGAEARPV